MDRKRKNMSKSRRNQGSGIIPVYPSRGIARKTRNKTHGTTKHLQGVGIICLKGKTVMTWQFCAFTMECVIICLSLTRWSFLTSFSLAFCAFSEN